MKKVILLIVLLFGLIKVVYSQQSFFKVYDFEHSSNGRQLAIYDDRYFISTSDICDNLFECSSVMEITNDGEIIWQKKLPFLDISRGMTVQNDTISIVGNDINTREKFLLHQMSIEQGERIATYEVFKEDELYTDMFYLRNIRFSHRNLIAGRGIKNDSMFALLYLVNDKGSVDSLIRVDSSDLAARIWDIHVDQDGNLIAYIEKSEAFGDDWRIIKKYNANFEEIWTYTTEKREHDRVFPRGTELQDGRIAFVYRHPDLDYISSVRVIDQEGNKDWQYDWFASGKTTTTIFRLRTLSNGDILGSGSYTDYNLEPGLEDAPFVFRMTPDGELLWQKVFFQLNEETDNSKTGTFWDIQELDDGGFMAVGFITNGHRDVLIVRTDENGCLIEKCEDITVLTATGDLTLEDPLLNVYPNPVNDILYLDFPNDVDLTQIELVNLNGQVVQTFKEDLRQLDLSSLESSIYFLRIIDKEGSVSTKKVIKL